MFKQFYLLNTSRALRKLAYRRIKRIVSQSNILYDDSYTAIYVNMAYTDNGYDRYSDLAIDCLANSSWIKWQAGN